MKIKNIWRFIPILLVVIVIIIFEGKGSLERKEFHEASINSYILQKKNNWSGGRSYDYVTEEGIVITLLSNDSLKIRDSISKEEIVY